MKVSELNANIIAQLETALGQTVPLFPKSFLRVLAKVMAGVYITLNKYAEWMTLQLFPETATLTETTVLGSTISPLKSWGRLVGCGDPYAAVPAELSIEITVTDPEGITLPGGSEFVDPNTNTTYRTITSVTLDSTTETVTVRCTVGGASGELAAGALLTCSNPVSTMYPIAEVAAITVSGVDAEDEESYRQRVIAYYQRKPQGGSYSDYYQWGMEASGIAAIYPYTGALPGEVDIYVKSATLTDGIPDATQLDAVSTEVNDVTRRPVNAYINVLPVVRVLFSVQVAGLNVDDADGAQADITTAVTDYIYGLEPFINGLSYGSRNDRLTVASVAAVVQSVVQQYAGSFGTVLLYKAGDPVDAYSLDVGELAKCTSVTYI